MSESGGGNPKHSHGDEQENCRDNSTKLLVQPAGNADQQHVGPTGDSSGPTTGGGVSAPSDDAAEGENQEIVECPVPGCTVKYQIGAMNLRSKVCSAHQKMDNFLIDGVDHRYCHQCYKIHPLTQFTGNKRSCTQRLERHNLRRRLNRLYKKSFSKDGGAAGAANTQPDHKAAVDLALQIMNATQPDDAPSSSTKAMGSSSRAAAGTAVRGEAGGAGPSTSVMASAAPVAPAVRIAPDAAGSSSSAREQEEANVGAAGAPPGLKAEGYDYMGSAQATEASRRAALGIGQQQQMSLLPFGGMQNHCGMCGGAGCSSCGGMPRNGDQRQRSSLRPSSQGVASGAPPSQAFHQATNIDSFLNEYDRYYDEAAETRMAAEEAEGLLRGQNRGNASGQTLMSPEAYEQQQGRGGMNEMPPQPEMIGSPPGTGSGRHSHSGMAVTPCNACGGFGCPLCSQDRYAQPSRSIRSQAGFPQDPRPVGRVAPPMGAGGNRGIGRQAAPEAGGHPDWQQGMAPPSSGQGQFQPVMRNPRGHPVYNISIKLFGDVTLAMLPPGLREEVQSWLNAAPLHSDEFLREGCVHLSIDFTLSTDEDYASAIQSIPDGLMSSIHSGNWPWCTCPVTVWLPDRVIHAEEGQIVSDSPHDESSHSLEAFSAGLATHKSMESHKAGRLIMLQSNDLKLPGLKVLLRSPADGRWEELVVCQGQGTVDACLPASASLSSSPDENTCTPEGSESGESHDTRFPSLKGNQATLLLEVPDSIQGGPAYVELVVDGDIGCRRQSRPIAVLLPPSSTSDEDNEINMMDS